MSVTDFWAKWSKNFPLTVTHSVADYGMPEGFTFKRAGESVFISKEEFAALAVPTEVDNELAEDLKLDPMPWARFPSKGNGGSRHADNPYGNLYFNPREGYSQNSKDYI